MPGWGSCAGNPESCTNAQVQTGYNTFRVNYLTAYTSTATANKDGNGAFIVSCHTHCEGQDDAAWAGFTVNGVTMKDAVISWLSAPTPEPAAKHTFVDCAYNAAGTPRQCNPSCKASESASATYGWPKLA